MKPKSAKERVLDHLESAAVPVWQDTNKKIKIVQNPDSSYSIAKGSKPPIKKTYSTIKAARDFAISKGWIKSEGIVQGKVGPAPKRLKELFLKHAKGTLNSKEKAELAKWEKDYKADVWKSLRKEFPKAGIREYMPDDQKELAEPLARDKASEEKSMAPATTTDPAKIVTKIIDRLGMSGGVVPSGDNPVKPTGSILKTARDEILKSVGLEAENAIVKYGGAKIVKTKTQAAWKGAMPGYSLPSTGAKLTDKKGLQDLVRGWNTFAPEHKHITVADILKEYTAAQAEERGRSVADKAEKLVKKYGRGADKYAKDPAVKEAVRRKLSELTPSKFRLREAKAPPCPKCEKPMITSKGLAGVGVCKDCNYVDVKKDMSPEAKKKLQMKLIKEGGAGETMAMDLARGKRTWLPTRLAKSVNPKGMDFSKYVSARSGTPPKGNWVIARKGAKAGVKPGSVYVTNKQYKQWQKEWAKANPEKAKKLGYTESLEGKAWGSIQAGDKCPRCPDGKLVKSTSGNLKCNKCGWVKIMKPSTKKYSFTTKTRPPLKERVISAAWETLAEKKAQWYSGECDYCGKKSDKLIKDSQGNLVHPKHKGMMETWLTAEQLSEGLASVKGIDGPEEVGTKAKKEGDVTQLMTQYVKRGNTFRPMGPITLKASLQPHGYNIHCPYNSPPVFEKVQARTDELLNFPNSVMESIIAEIDKFWKIKPNYERLGFLHSRGILVYGPPGTGKSSLMQQVAELMINRSDVVFFVNSVSQAVNGLRAFREVEPDRKGLVVLEDIDEYISYAERPLLQLLSGDNSVDNVLYLGSTNYIEKFTPRLLRPGRFDKTIFLGPPPIEGRLAYLNYKLDGIEKPKAIEFLAKQTDGLSFGHLRELVIGAYALREPVIEVVKRLSPTVSISAEDEERFKDHFETDGRSKVVEEKKK